MDRERRGAPRRYLATLVVVAIGLSSSLAAQTANRIGGRTLAPLGENWHLRVAGGPDLSQIKSSSLGVLGLDWQRPDSRMGLRFGAEYLTSSIVGADAGSHLCETSVCSLRNSTRLGGLSADVRGDLTKGSVRPYLFSGVGLYRAEVSSRMNLRCDPQHSCVRTPGEFTTLTDKDWTIALHAGVGLSAQIGRAQLFTEARLQALRLESRFAQPRDVKPLVFGIRF